MTDTTADESCPDLDSVPAIGARYLEIAPPPFSSTPEPARPMARWLTLAAQRGYTRMLNPCTPLEFGEVAEMCAQFGMLHVLAHLISIAPGSADELTGQILSALDDGDGIGEFLQEHGRKLGVDTAEVSRLADREAELEAADPDAAGPEVSDAERADTAEQACKTLAVVTEWMAQNQYAAWIDASRGDMDAVRQRVLDAEPDVHDGPPWDGHETGAEWIARTSDHYGNGKAGEAIYKERAQLQASINAIRMLCTTAAAAASSTIGIRVSPASVRLSAGDVLAILSGTRETPSPLADPDRAAAALASIAVKHERVMHAARIDLARGDAAAAAHLLDEQLDGYDGPPWDGTETGLAWLTRTGPAPRRGTAPASPPGTPADGQ